MAPGPECTPFRVLQQSPGSGHAGASSGFRGFAVVRAPEVRSFLCFRYCLSPVFVTAHAQRAKHPQCPLLRLWYYAQETDVSQLRVLDAILSVPLGGILVDEVPSKNPTPYFHTEFCPLCSGEFVSHTPRG